MDIPSSVLNHPFELAPVLIPGWVTELRPVGIAYAGIPHSLFGTGGLQCVISAWTELKSGAWTMAAYDRVDLYVNDVLIPEAGFTVQPGQENEDFYSLYLPQGKLREGVNKLHYKVTRLSGNFDVSNPIDVLYHLRAPGEPAPQNLDLVVPPDVISDGVSADRAAAGVTFGFTYGNRRDFDRIEFLIGGVTKSYDVPSAPASAEYTLFTDTFIEVGNGAFTALQFNVTDQLGNSNRSSIKYIDIHLNQELVKPTIESATGLPSNADIPPGGSTTETTVILSGVASAGLDIELFDNAATRGRFTATAGTWASSAIPVALGSHSFTAEALYGSGEVSAPYIFTVSAAIPELVIDPTPVNLSAVHHRSHVTPSHPPAGAYVDRLASGGVGPYGYYSSNPDVAEVNASTGRVISKGTGSATITAYDQTGLSASYAVNCANIMWHFGMIRQNYVNSNNWVRGQGGRLPAESEYALLRASYGGNGLAAGVGEWRNWIPDPGGAPLGKKYVINPGNGQKFLITDWGTVGGVSENADGYGVKNK